MSEATSPQPRDARRSRRVNVPHSTRPFHLVLVAGADPARAVDIADTVATITGPTGALQSFKDAKLTPSDLRAKVIMLAEGDIDAALSSYAVATGFATRMLDVATDQGVATTTAHAEGMALPDEGKAPNRPELIVVVGDRPAPDDLAATLGVETVHPVEVITFENGSLSHLDAAAISRLRSARRVALVRSSAIQDAFAQLLHLAGVRARKGFERFPILVGDNEPIELDELRREGAALRKVNRDYTVAVATRLEPTDRQVRLEKAASVDMRLVLGALGSASSSELWQCPRPWSHTHGDATPSLQVSEENKVRCYVDDTEWIDPLRLVMEVCRVTPDEAASLLLTGPSAFEPFKERILTERARRAKV